MFKIISPIITAATTLLFTVAREDEGRLRLTFTPRVTKKKDDDEDDEITVHSIANTPLVITGTPEELDDSMADKLTEYLAKRQTAINTIETMDAELEALKKEKQKLIDDEKGEVNKKKDKAKPKAPEPKPEPPESPADRVAKLMASKAQAATPTTV